MEKIHSIDALRGPAGQGSGPVSRLGGAAARCPSCREPERGEESVKADLASKLALLQGGVLGSMFAGPAAPAAPRETGNLTGGGLNGIAGLGLNPLLG